MGISINVGTNQSYSYLFQGSSSGGSMGNLNFLSDYGSIKNGSYAKLMKAYYGTGQNSGTVQNVNSSTSATSTKRSASSNVVDKILDAKRNPTVSKGVQEANANLTAGLSSLKTSVSALQNDKTYTDTANGQSAADKTVSALKAYVSDYNSVVSAAKGSTLTSKTAYVANMMRSTTANADKLSEIGITVNDNGTLDFNEAGLKAADISKVQKLFSPKDIMSYGSTVASRLQFAGSAAGSNAATGSTETNTTASSSAASLKADSKVLASDKLYEKIKDKDGNETDDYDVDKIFATL